MGFSLGSVVGAIANPISAAFGGLAGGLLPTPPGAPQLPGAPTLQSPTLPNYPGFTPDQLALLGQERQSLSQFGNALNGYATNPLTTGQDAINQTQMQNYQNALQGHIPPNQAIEQQKQRDWQQTVEQAGQQGIRLSGDKPESAVSQSTAGNQIIQDFNKRYGALEQQYNLGQQQFLQGANVQSLGLAQSGLNTQAGAYGAYGNQAANLMQPYTQQQLGPFNVATQQAVSNTATQNQNLSNRYGADLGQVTSNYNNALLGYGQQMGLFNNLLSLGGQVGGAALTSGMGGGMRGGTPASTGGATYIPQGGGGYGSLGLAPSGNPLNLNYMRAA